MLYLLKILDKMEQREILKNKLLKALNDSNYEVEIIEPDNVELCQKYNGTQFLVVHGDTMRYSPWCGNCSVSILGHRFTCDFNYGEWSTEQREDEWLLEDEEFMNELESAEGVISGERTLMDDQRMVYCRANNMSEDIDIYWVEEDGIPKNINNLDWCDPEAGTITITLKGGEKKDVECGLDCSSIYQLYCNLKGAGKLYKSPTISSKYIKKELPKLHKEILDELQSKGGLSDVKNLVRYSLNNRKAFFESILG